jgi:hypothetical protein
MAVDYGLLRSPCNRETLAADTRATPCARPPRPAPSSSRERRAREDERGEGARDGVRALFSVPWGRERPRRSEQPTLSFRDRDRAINCRARGGSNGAPAPRERGAGAQVGAKRAERGGPGRGRGPGLGRGLRVGRTDQRLSGGECPLTSLNEARSMRSLPWPWHPDHVCSSYPQQTESFIEAQHRHLGQLPLLASFRRQREARSPRPATRICVASSPNRRGTIVVRRRS